MNQINFQFFLSIELFTIGSIIQRAGIQILTVMEIQLKPQKA